MQPNIENGLRGTSKYQKMLVINYIIETFQNFLPTLKYAMQDPTTPKHNRNKNVFGI